MPIFLPYSISLSTLIVGIHLMVEYNHLFNENRTLQHTNQLDPLTGAYNRRVLQEIDPEIYHFAVVIDLNDFKALNDSRGHIVGDQVLSDFTQVIRDNLRQDDLVIRWGGDEFLLVLANLPETSNSYQMVENILQRVSDQFDGSHPGLDLSFSYGIVMMQASLEHSLEEADRRMYAMKEIHHNRASADFVP
jgi:diguanylate cyclase (GGDEF)-like protein